MWRYIHESNGENVWVNQEQIVKIEPSSEGFAILYCSDGSVIQTDEECEQFLIDGNILQSWKV